MEIVSDVTSCEGFVKSMNYPTLQNGRALRFAKQSLKSKSQTVSQAGTGPTAGVVTDNRKQ
ncbi:hypothetical protein FD03_GL000992 [Companilactobacillus nodensis DSM 19682 = JCM 14932 = NBRC 107160]|uniref:Uncharacterized protein n=2 Tax=Companilactobacillus nodensis TaxID=460870 RepID=A0A0R1KLI5_9LACO|nr:hypothetical protein FD03_GL000992 [Companilactobacillus nodensis DSM 19682 = JCM 14932 = NBRC 107160]